MPDNQTSLKEDIFNATRKKFVSNAAKEAESLVQSGQAEPEQLLLNMAQGLQEKTPPPVNESNVFQLLNQLSQQETPVTEGGLFDRRKGLTSTLVDLAQGNGFTMFQPKTQPVGQDSAIKLLNLMLSAQRQSETAERNKVQGTLGIIGESRQQAGERREQKAFPLEQAARKQGLQKGKIDITRAQTQQEQDLLNLASQVAEITGNTEPLDVLLGKQGVGVPSETKGRRTAKVKEEFEMRKVFNEAVPEAVKGYSSLDRIQRASIALGDFESGLFQQLGGRGKAAIETFARTPEYTNFASSIGQEGDTLTRTLAGAKGVLTDKDVDRMTGTLRDPSIPVAQKMQSIAEFKLKARRGLKTNAQQAGISFDEFAKKIPVLEKLMSVPTPINAQGAEFLGINEIDPETGEGFNERGESLGFFTPL